LPARPLTRGPNRWTSRIGTALFALMLSSGLLVSASGGASATPTTTTYPQMVTYKATLVDVQYVQGGRCYWGIGPEWAPYNPQHGGVVGNYSLTWTNGSLNYYAPDNSAQKIGTKLFVAFTGGGGPAPCGPPDPHEGGRFPSLTVTVSAGITYPTTTTTAPTAHTITGTIDYYYASGDGFAHGAPASTQVTPSRETMVEILASSSSSCSNIVLSSIYTDDFGDYSSTVSATNKYVCVKIIAATSYSEIIPYPSTVDASGGAHVFYDAYATKALGPTRLKTSGDTTYSWKPTGVSAPIDQALDIDNAIIPGGEWLSAYGTTPKFLNILYPYPASKAISNFNADTDIGEINEDDAFDWGVLLHEYGHFVASLIGIDNTTPVSSNKHELGWNMTDHEGNKAQGLAIAWDEGFADFFSQMVQRVMGTSSLGLTDVGGTPPSYVDYTPTGTISFRLDVSGNTSPRSKSWRRQRTFGRACPVVGIQPADVFRRVWECRLCHNLGPRHDLEQLAHSLGRGECTPRRSEGDAVGARCGCQYGERGSSPLASMKRRRPQPGGPFSRARMWHQRSLFLASRLPGRRSHFRGRPVNYQRRKIGWTFFSSNSSIVRGRRCSAKRSCCSRRTNFGLDRRFFRRQRRSPPTGKRASSTRSYWAGIPPQLRI
jgi:hypothetical protein